MSRVKKWVIEIRKKIINFSYKFEKYTLMIMLKIRVKKAFVNKKSKIDKQYKKDIRKYWYKYKKNISTSYFKMYSDVNGLKDVRYIPDDIWWYNIENYFNKIEFSTGVDDKNYYDILLKDIKQPKTVIKNIENVFYNNKFEIVEKKEAIDIIYKELLNDKELVIKPSVDSCGGSNVKIINTDTNIEDLLNDYKCNFIIQHLIKQSEELAKIHPNSVNTVRTMSLLYKNEVKILSSVLRMGINGSRVDNASAGGITCGINSDGTLKEKAYDKHGKCYVNHPGGGTVPTFAGYKIEGYDKIIDIIKEQHKKFAHFKIISWDFAIDENKEPIFIEFNLKAGELDFHQFNNGPILGDLTDEVLEEIFIKNKR